MNAYLYSFKTIILGELYSTTVKEILGSEPLKDVELDLIAQSIATANLYLYLMDKHIPHERWVDLNNKLHWSYEFLSSTRK